MTYNSKSISGGYKNDSVAKFSLDTDVSNCRRHYAGLCCNTPSTLSFDMTRRLGSYWASQVG